jgi:hypothetical protein
MGLQNLWAGRATSPMSEWRDIRSPKSARKSKSHDIDTLVTGSRDWFSMYSQTRRDLAIDVK